MPKLPNETQKQQMLRMLLEAKRNGDAVCCTVFLNVSNRMPRYAARKADLKADGYLIVTERCDRGHKHTTPQWQYRLVDPAQQTFDGVS